MKVDLRTASTMCGELCVMTPGEVLMLLWCVDSWATLFKVSNMHVIYLSWATLLSVTCTL